MRVACVLIPHYVVQIEVKRCPDLQGKPVVLVHSKGSRRFIYDASPRASGVSPGMALSTALGHCKEAVLLDANLPLYNNAANALLEALSRVSPVVEDSAPGLAYVDVHGLSEMYGGEARMVTALLQAVPNGFAPQVGIGDGKFPAYIAATLAHYHGAAQAPEEPSSYLANVLVGMLPVSFKTILHLLGFRVPSIVVLASRTLIAKGGMYHDGRSGWASEQRQVVATKKQHR